MMSDVMTQIKSDQAQALKEEQLKKERMVWNVDQLRVNEYGVKTIYGRIWISRYGDMKIKILNEAHKTQYSIHPGGTKMFQDLRKEYWWADMKFDIIKYVSNCLTCL
jgi:hypothetical protein